MAKKKATTKPRPKKLRLISIAPIGLSETQQAELRELYRPLAHMYGHSIPFDDVAGQRRLALERMLFIYVEALCHDAMVENAGLRKRRTLTLRRQVMKEISKLCKRELSPGDIVKLLAKHAPVPDYAKSAIYRDYLGVTVT
jgi:hypothetical protein